MAIIVGWVVISTGQESIVSNKLYVMCNIYFLKLRFMTMKG